MAERQANAPAQSAPERSAPRAPEQPPIGRQAQPDSVSPDVPPSIDPRQVGPQQQLPAAAAGPLYDRAGKLTRPGMERVIRGGGSVLWDGRHIGRIEDLPSAAELARTDEDRASARADIARRQRELDDQRAQLDAAEPPANKR